MVESKKLIRGDRCGSVMKRGCIWVALVVAVAGAVLWTVQTRRTPNDPLLSAIVNGDVSEAKRVLDGNPSLVNRDYGGATRPIHFAVLTNRRGSAMVELLIKRGADPNARDDAENTPVMLATSTGHIDSLRALLRNGGDPNALSKRGVSALHVAAWKGNARAVRTLVEGGAQVNIWDATARRYTPLHYAARFGKADAASVLIENGADLNAKSRDGTPLEVAKRHDEDAIAQLISRRMGGGAPAE